MYQNQKTAYIKKREREKIPRCCVHGWLLSVVIANHCWPWLWIRAFVCVYELCFLKHKKKLTTKWYFLGFGLAHDPEVILISNWVKNYRGDSRVVKFGVFFLLNWKLWLKVFACFRQTGSICQKCSSTHGIIVDLSLSHSIYQ